MKPVLGIKKAGYYWHNTEGARRAAERLFSLFPPPTPPLLHLTNMCCIFTVYPHVLGAGDLDVNKTNKKDALMEVKV